MVYSTISSETVPLVTNNAAIVDTIPYTKRYEMQPKTSGNSRSFLKVIEEVDILKFLSKENNLQAVEFSPMFSPPYQYVVNHLIL
jgi:hypothetical protein